jgi:hypothetical protein
LLRKWGSLLPCSIGGDRPSCCFVLSHEVLLFFLFSYFSFLKPITLQVQSSTFNMTATIDVEEVLSKLDIVEKVSLLAGAYYSPNSIQPLS